MANGTPRVLMFAPMFYPPLDPEAIVTAKLVLAMMEVGWQVDVICEQAEEPMRYTNGEKEEDIWFPLHNILHCMRRPSLLSIQGACARIKGIMWSRGHGPLGWSSMAAFKAMELARQKKWDVILSRSLPLYGHLPAMIIARQLGIPWIANWNDPSPNQKSPPPYGGGPNARISFLINRLIRALAKFASWHTFPCERLRDYMCSCFPGFGFERSSVVPHIALNQLVKMKPRLASEVFSLCYTGKIGKDRQPKVFLTGLKLFLRRRPDAKVKVTFISNRSPELFEAAKVTGLEHLINTETSKPYVYTLNAMHEHDVLVIIESPVDEGIFLPSKFVDYVQTGRPILALSPAVGTLRDFLSNGGGIAVDCRFSDHVANAITGLYDHWRQGTLDTVYSSSRLFDLVSESLVLNEYHRLFQQLKVIPEDDFRY